MIKSTNQAHNLLPRNLLLPKIPSPQFQTNALYLSISPDKINIAASGQAVEKVLYSIAIVAGVYIAFSNSSCNCKC